MKSNIIFYCDMDGVIARYNKETMVRDMRKEGYFRRCEPEPGIIAALKIIKSKGFDVRILSSVHMDGGAAADKRWWLDNVAGLKDIPAIFVPCGEKKNNYIDNSRPGILIDDYSRNLHYWTESGNIGVKFMNRINGSHGTWKSNRISVDMPPDEMASRILAYASERKSPA